MIQRILARARGFHGRVASREQVQIPLGFPQNEQWLDLFLRCGPPGYAITGADGAELSDRWDEALFLKDRVREIWKRG